MDILKIILIGIITCIATIVLKQFKPELAIIVSLAGGLVILLSLINHIGKIVGNFSFIASQTNINMSLFTNILKIVGVGYLCEFGANVCIDTGNNSIADKVLLGGKIIILCLAFPIINTMLSTIMGLIKWKEKRFLF